jgi:hypothetical protein
MGFEADWPSAAYEFVMESITDCAFSCPISASMLERKSMRESGAQTLVIVDDVSEMIAATIMGLSNAHRVVREVDIAVVACSKSVGAVEG